MIECYLLGNMFYSINVLLCISALRWLQSVSLSADFDLFPSFRDKNEKFSWCWERERERKEKLSCRHCTNLVSGEVWSKLMHCKTVNDNKTISIATYLLEVQKPSFCFLKEWNIVAYAVVSSVAQTPMLVCMKVYALIGKSFSPLSFSFKFKASEQHQDCFRTKSLDGR